MVLLCYFIYIFMYQLYLFYSDGLYMFVIWLQKKIYCAIIVDTCGGKMYE